jgi:hypothetical protein
VLEAQLSTVVQGLIKLLAALTVVVVVVRVLPLGKVLFITLVMAVVVITLTMVLAPVITVVVA